MGYLDNEGLARLWGKTRAYARSAYTAGVGIEIAEGAISLETPTVPITQAEYEALSEEEREGKLFLVTDAPDSIPVNVEIEDYDTEDGWHVRKYADGYVEQIYKKLVTIAVADWVSILTNESGNGVYSVGDPYFPPVALPVAMTEKLGEVYSVASGNWSTIAAHAGVSASNQVNPNTHIDRFTLYRMGTPITSPLTCTMTVMVTGRWK